jgi:hypothetical protein
MAAPDWAKYELTVRPKHGRKSQPNEDAEAFATFLFMRIGLSNTPSRRWQVDWIHNKRYQGLFGGWGAWGDAPIYLLRFEDPADGNTIQSAMAYYDGFDLIGSGPC